jgi:hypothetical protein
LELEFLVVETYNAKEAVTKTDAKPPIPPTKGASPFSQFLPPMYSWSLFPPQLTAIPRMMKIWACQLSTWRGDRGTYNNRDDFE